MSGLASRNKGKAGEREVIRMLQPVIDILAQRNGVETIVLERDLGQSRRGGHDVIGLTSLAIEVKNCRQLALEQWWVQTVRQAKENQTPLLLYKVARLGWRARTRALVSQGNIRVRIIIDVDIRDYLPIFTEIVLAELTENGE